MIYGCSQKVMLLNCSNNNRAETVCDVFLKAVREHANPLQVRGYMGSENRFLAKDVTLLRNYSRNGFIGGRSTHNIGIERFWR